MHNQPYEEYISQFLGTAYVEYIFRDRVLSIIENHDPSNGPLYSNPPLPGTPTPLSQVLQPPSPKYSNPPLPGTPTPLSQVLHSPSPQYSNPY